MHVMKPYSSDHMQLLWGQKPHVSKMTTFQGVEKYRMVIDSIFLTLHKVLKLKQKTLTDVKGD